MTIRFPYADNTQEDEDIILDPSDEEDEEDDDVSATGTEVSASEFAGKLAQAPAKMFFGARECGAIFSLPSDQGLFVRVCGCSASSCHRKGHPTLSLTEVGHVAEGWYDTVVSRKFVDGKLGTRVSKEDHAGQMAMEADQRYKELEQVGAQWEGKARSPDGSSYEEVEAEMETTGTRTRAQRGAERGSSFGFFSPKARDSVSPAADATSLSEIKNQIGNFFRGSNDKDPKEGMVVELLEDDDDDKSTDAMRGMMSTMARQMKELQEDLKDARAATQRVLKALPPVVSALREPTYKAARGANLVKPRATPAKKASSGGPLFAVVRPRSALVRFQMYQYLCTGGS